MLRECSFTALERFGRCTTVHAWRRLHTPPARALRLVKKFEIVATFCFACKARKVPLGEIGKSFPKGHLDNPWHCCRFGLKEVHALNGVVVCFRFPSMSIVFQQKKTVADILYKRKRERCGGQPSPGEHLANPIGHFLALKINGTPTSNALLLRLVH